jgi:hypothetical protein
MEQSGLFKQWTEVAGCREQEIRFQESGIGRDFEFSGIEIRGGARGPDTPWLALLALWTVMPVREGSALGKRSTR